MKLLEQLLSLISEAVLLPTLAAIVILVAWSAMLLGGLLREWLGRRTVQATLTALRRAHVEGADPVRMLHILGTATTGLPARMNQLLSQWGGAADLPHCLVELEIETATTLSRLTWMTRIAPMLGLMGTLIPLGPALTGLASGDLATLSSNLVVAFTATVVGVLLGCTSYTMNLVRKNWYQRDLSTLEHLFVSAQSPAVIPSASAA
ncbi:MotA/TolQ/ExbB proton channel family protein [Prosthecobacter sp.]|uniref:MotA/TolQ/ExbB proton channel family protein n=1 Tax=Prosthecobacter sp. TaxID=1965333 RepID=UPI0037852871